MLYTDDNPRASRASLVGHISNVVSFIVHQVWPGLESTSLNPAWASKVLTLEDVVLCAFIGEFRVSMQMNGTGSPFTLFVLETH